jgi:hypothetical protein
VILALHFTLVDFELPKSRWFLTETAQYPNGAVNFQILGRFDTYGECMAQRGNNDDRECVTKVAVAELKHNRGGSSRTNARSKPILASAFAVITPGLADASSRGAGVAGPA